MKLDLKKEKNKTKYFVKTIKTCLKKKKTEGLTRSCKSGVLIGKLPKKTIYTHT